MFTVETRAAALARFKTLLVVTVFASLAACGKGEATAEQAAEPVSPPAELAAADVAVVEARALSRVLPLSGSLTPVVQATVKSKVAGELLSVNVREGQAVKRGDVLARIDTRNQQAMVDSQRAAVDKARADLAMAKLTLDNNQRLVDKHFIAQNVLDASKSQYDASVAGVKVVVAQAHMAEISLADAVVRAPISGVVAKRMVQPGEKVSPDAPLLSLVDLSALELQASAPASEVPLVKIGQLAHFKVDGFGERRFEARVERINPVAEAGSRSITVYLAVPNPDGTLKGGMFAQGSLALDANAAVPVIPLAALRGNTEAGSGMVLVVKDGKLAERQIKLGLKSEAEGLVEVREGLAVGEQVVTATGSTLKAGLAVLLKADDAPAVAAKVGG